MKVVLGCAGYNTRLPNHITKGLPKHLLEIGGKPLIDFTLEKLENIPEVDEIYLVTNGLFFEVFQNYLSSRNFKKTIHLINNGTNRPEEKLGSVGDILKVLQDKKINDDVGIFFPDNLHNFELNEMITHFLKLNSPLLVCYDVKDKKIASTLGVVKVKNNVITELKEKPENPESTLTSIAIYLFPKNTLHRFGEYKEEGNNLDRMGDFNSWIVEREKVFAYIYGPEFKWFDIGTEFTYNEALKTWLT